VRFIAERDSLNASVLGPDAAPGTPEFDAFVREVAREMTVKAGQKCTAIRRAMVPAEQLDAVQEALGARLAKVRIGNPREEGVHMGALASHDQLRSVREAVAELSRSARIVSGDPNRLPCPGDGAFIEPILLRSDDPWGSP
jgi:oxepin-CoA hydrolase/3-oxo-5,6-dehydrosuberyl-CoA semialdehyde dehydrogenase